MIPENAKIFLKWELEMLKLWKGRVPGNLDGQYWMWDQYLGILVNLGYSWIIFDDLGILVNLIKSWKIDILAF